ncbi:MAG: glycosyltransferase family 2 protein [Solobacterium sp.]|nr:glycosyltransferase family 2 protein [Solobacterium sp.]
MTKVSVIIPVYNTEKYLPESLDSVLDQTLQDLEVICINDASTDRSGEILDSYAARDSRVHVIHLKKNRRQGNGRNIGMEHAKGQYLYFLDSDDMIEPYAMQELYDLSEKEHLDVVFFDSRNVFDSEEMKKIYIPAFSVRKGVYEDKVYTGQELFDAFIRQNEWTCYPQRTFWSADFIRSRKIRNPVDSEHEDEYFAHAGILLAERARYIRKQYFILRIRPDSVMTREPGPRNFHGYLMNYYYMNRFAAEHNIHTEASRANISRMYELARSYYDRLNGRFDLRGYCSRRKTDLVIYENFVSHLDTGYRKNYIDAETLERMSHFREVYIYGAGIVAKRFAAALLENGNLVLGGFIVSAREGNPEVLFGRPVMAMEEAHPADGALVVIAVSAKLYPEIREILEKTGWNWMYYRKLD